MRAAAVAGAAARGPRPGWCIAKVGQNPLNYNFLAAPGRRFCRAPPQAVPVSRMKPFLDSALPAALQF
ncbi:hypothetical protein DM47_1859 [Burkholderia mallei]|nr:hypothetical protein DO73_4226 [Burkholderia pseudomallei]KGC60752.1 hypothetical protein DM75_2860 [Burkholderia mallei]KGS61171.1 hypothetical protein X990_5480 [Burkholderia pseudomallei MSHR4868]KGX49562.1 hypothetical protein Y025_5594 [Burkholderia pseudomallei TSV32]KGD23925.1 hypothetical protein DP42_4785 [Burkholderia pseudomallei]